MEFYQILALTLSVAYLMLGGGYMIYIYDAYRRTSQGFLLQLAVGFFLLITGGALPVLAYIAELLDKSTIVLAIVLQIAGLTTIFYSTVK